MNIFLDLENADLLKLGGKPIDEAVELKIESHVKKEDEKRFRCSVNGCKKLFKGPEFVKKHIEKRHSEWLNEAKKEFILLNNYVLDTSRVFPIEAYSYSDIVNQRGTLKNDSDVSPKSITQLPASGSFHFCPPSEKININYDQDINFKKSLSGKSLYNKPKVFNEHKGKSDGKMLRVYKDLDRVIDETPDLNY
ncbi:hypothetical protein MERGE_003024 [Pneumocystis wakefieldiae]|uniref:C2H2-type domain-containing protein n=1 Tax=Pneumocystis wakefieldiae TaxID=38082 RepID=A0A899FVB2_9ASCO|nr:hypothetical protein MERGE_003024 [Pneumocystis wakefieldiae]